MPYRPGTLPRRFLYSLALLLAAAAGCTRTHYREHADRDAYGIEYERLLDPRWNVPLRPVEPDARARYRDVHDPDASPTPLDDPYSYRFQVSERLHPIQSFQKKVRERGVTPIEDPAWLACLPRNAEGEVLLDRDSAMRLAVLHSRDYQFQIEQLYLTALNVDIERFRYQIQPFASQAVDYQVSGAPSNGSSQIIPVGRAGFLKRFYSGAQLLVDFTNNLLFEYDGDGFSTARSSLLVSFTQPLLRGAFARNVTQPLSLAERFMLYAVRDFARYRRIFYVRTVAGGGYLGLLQQVQAIRNAEENLVSLERNLRETEALVAANFKSRSERDQVALSYQQAQVNLLSLQAGLETALDAYRVELGLPPNLPMKIVEKPLELFEFNDARLDQLRSANDELYLSLLQTDSAPPRDELLSALSTLNTNQERLAALLGEVRNDLDRWRTRLHLVDERGEVPLPEPPEGASEAERFEFNLAVSLDTSLREAAESLTADTARARKLAQLIAGAAPDALAEPWKELRDLVGDNFRSRLSDAFVTQTLARVYLIELTPVDLDEQQAVAIAICNRQDLMNARSRVADAWRNVEVAANALQADLDLTYSSNFATDPNFDGIFRFDASASLHRVGLRFDAPIVRRVERNAYRAAQIAYQRERRAYMLTRDEIVRQVRLDLRELLLTRRQFDIGREQLVTSARAVEENEINLRSSREPDAGLTLLLLTSLNNLLSARNGLIGNWVQYETSRLSLFRDLDIMNIDAQGVWINERVPPTAFLTTPAGVASGDGERSDGPPAHAFTSAEPPLPPLPE